MILFFFGMSQNFSSDLSVLMKSKKSLILKLLLQILTLLTLAPYWIHPQSHHKNGIIFSWVNFVYHTIYDVITYKFNELILDGFAVNNQCPAFSCSFHLISLLLELA